MKKKLVIKFWKTERALAMQVVEQAGLPKDKNSGVVKIINIPYLGVHNIYLEGKDPEGKYNVDALVFDTNQERDEYLTKMTQAITDELFTGQGELKVGETCEVRSYPDDDWLKKKLIAVLPNNYHDRFIIQSDIDANDWFYYRYARPITKRTEPKVETNGEIVTYTWEEE